MLSHKLFALLLLASASSFAATISFSVLNTGAGLASYSEAGFQFTRVSGSQACIDSNRFSPGCVNAPAVGDRFDVTRIGGGLFTFTQFDSASESNRDGMRFIGEVNGVITQQLSPVPSPAAGNSIFSTFSTNFTGPIDRLRLEISSVGSNFLQLDNLVLTAADAPSDIPEPSTLYTFGAAALALGFWRRRAS